MKDFQDKTKAAITAFDKYAAQYADKYMDITAYHPALDKFCALLGEDREVRLLDIACGPGNITKYVLAQRPNSKMLGIDLSPSMLELAQANNPSAEFQLLDGREISTLKEKYHGIICGFCLPYLSREESEQLIHSAAKLLTPGGVFYLSTMEGDYTTSGWEGPSDGGADRVFIHYHQEDYLTAALLKSGLEIRMLERIVTPTQAGKEVTDLVMVAQKMN